jgi:FKBP-type peptidyl-prolyl cis-trans isomerase FkpA
VGALTLLIVLVFVGAQMGLLSGNRPANLGASEGKLREVDDKPENSVSSQTRHARNRIDPLPAGDDPAASFETLLRLVDQTPGTTTVTRQPGYAHVEFETRLMKFVDDVEFLLDADAGVIHVRSASRLGRKDFGANRERIESLRGRLRTALAATPPSTSPSTGEANMNAQTLPNGLQIIELETGGGDEAVAGRQVAVHYTGWLYENGENGAQFDSSHSRGEPIRFPLGAGHVIRGWDEGVAGMRVGGKRTLIIPPELGYGARGAGGVIPPNATLRFDVELVAVQ